MELVRPPSFPLSGTPVISAWTGRSDHGPPRMASPTADAATSGHLYLDATRCARTSWRAPEPASRRASTSSATAPCARSREDCGPQQPMSASTPWWPPGTGWSTSRCRTADVVADDGRSRRRGQRAAGIRCSLGCAGRSCTIGGWGGSGPAGMNPFGSLAKAGVVLAFGSDSPITSAGSVGRCQGGRVPPRGR